ncbi:MAG TPA: hypothetical protein VIH04_07580 [Nitrosarchaeum sp.]
MNKTTSKILTGSKYVYLIAFFALLSGFFHPLITNTSFDIVVVGVMVLFVGLAGGILLYKSTISEKRRMIFLGGGFTLIAISLFYIFQITGRV